LPSAVSREEVIVESASGLISVAGGKLTTHREIAERIVDRAASVIGRGIGRSPTLDTPLPGARPLLDGQRPGVDGVDALGGLPENLRAAMIGRYGTRAAIAAGITVESPELARPLTSGCAVAEAEVMYAARYEMATSVADFIVRRTAMSWRDPGRAREAAGAVARLMAIEYGWDREREQAEIAACNLPVGEAPPPCVAARLHSGTPGDE
jgi:glycerol-3-phosphate dehydrogenase